MNIKAAVDQIEIMMVTDFNSIYSLLQRVCFLIVKVSAIHGKFPNVVNKILIDISTK